MLKEIRWFKGAYKVLLLKKKYRPKRFGGSLYEVQALEDIPIVPDSLTFGEGKIIEKGEVFTTVPQLLWKKQKRSC